VVVRFLLDERADDDAGERSSNTPLHRKAREYPLGNWILAWTLSEGATMEEADGTELVMRSREERETKLSKHGRHAPWNAWGTGT
jgi:hypothetical protein